jgi:hypothetical protein
MISCKRTLGWTLCWVVASAAVTAEEPGPEGATGAADLTMAAEATEPSADATPEASDPDSTDPMSESEMATAEGAGMDVSTTVDAVPMETLPALGAVAWDSEGRQGRIHLVASGDTLWHISDAYLGTPWVWPSIWKDNGEIANPHVIHPGDRIWITATEMRRITADEADAMLANRPQEPAAMEPAAMEDAVPGMEPTPALPAPARMVKVSARESTGLISPQVYESSASVVERDVDRMMMSQEDGLFIGLGESEVQPGDEFTLFRTNQKVMDPDTGALLGYHVDMLGWVRVEETFPETSRASIRMSTGEIEIGDRVMPRQALPNEIEVRPVPEGVEGKITFFPMRRVLLGWSDFVYLNRGTLDGLEVGSPLEVFRASSEALEVTRDEQVEVPDRVIATMLVVRAEEETAVALVTKAETELSLGDRFRGEGASEE